MSEEKQLSPSRKLASKVIYAAFQISKPKPKRILKTIRVVKPFGEKLLGDVR